MKNKKGFFRAAPVGVFALCGALFALSVFGADSGGANKSAAPAVPVKSAAAASSGASVAKIVPVEVGDAASEKKLSPMLFVSVQDAAMEWWFKVPPDSVPHISQIKKVFFNQNFGLFPFVSNAAVKDGKFALSYSVKCTYPDGSEKIVVKSAEYRGEKASRDVIVACPDVVTVSFDNSHRDGKYIFTFLVKDEISGVSAAYTNDVDLVSWSAPNPFAGAKLVRDYLKYFYLQPSPETLWSIFFSKDFSLEQKGAPNSLNYSNIGFLKSAFARNDFLLGAARDAFKEASKLDRAKIVFLMAICSESPLDESLLSDKEKAYQKRVRDAKIPDPYAEWDGVMGAAQVDMLWGEFYADGTYKSLRRIMDLISHTEEAAFAENLKEARRRPQTPEEWKKFMLGLLNRAALLTIAQHSYDMPLVDKYCRWAMANNDIPTSSREILVPFMSDEEAQTPQSKSSVGEKPDTKKASSKKSDAAKKSEASGKQSGSKNL